jgi:uncharacterized protein (UPF0254 family)
VVAENTDEQVDHMLAELIVKTLPVDRMIAETVGVGRMSSEALGIGCTLAEAIVEAAGRLLALEVALTVGHM